ncbi:MAG: hypothetical protein HYY40_09660 [Bacteroidetes bacterium]|nr:hypothetical protein [Bacteroidota bacterium]
MDDNTFNTGIYLAEKSFQNIYKKHNYFMEKYFNHSIPKKGLSTGFIPYNIDFSKLAQRNIILTGDAAGLCDKMFGHGVDNAIISGYLAIESICNAENTNNTYPLNEIYRYKLGKYLNKSLSYAIKTYETLKENKVNYLDSLEALIKPGV